MQAWTKKKVRDLRVGEKEEKKSPGRRFEFSTVAPATSLNEEGLLRPAATDQASDLRRHVGKQKQQTTVPCQARHQGCRAGSQRGLRPISQPKESIYARVAVEKARRLVGMAVPVPSPTACSIIMVL